MILSVNLNPCIDKSVEVNGLRVGELNRCKPLRRDAAGKGLNVATAAKHLGADAFSIGFNYSENGRLVTNLLEREGVPYDHVVVLGSLRTNLKLFDSVSGVYTDLNEPGAEVPPEALSDLRFRIRRRAERSQFVTLSGSVPNGVPMDIYRTLIEDVSQYDVRVVLDAENALLREGIKAKPWMIKPNLSEMELLFERTYEQEEEIIKDARSLVEQGVELVCVSMGALGALLVSGQGVWKAEAVAGLQAKGFQGAGDSMVAGICVAAQKGLELPEMLRYGVAAASATIIREGTQMCAKQDFDRLLPQVRLHRLA